MTSERPITAPQPIGSSDLRSEHNLHLPRLTPAVILAGVGLTVLTGCGLTGSTPHSKTAERSVTAPTTTTHETTSLPKPTSLGRHVWVSTDIRPQETVTEAAISTLEANSQPVSEPNIAVDTTLIERYSANRGSFIPHSGYELIADSVLSVPLTSKNLAFKFRSHVASITYNHSPTSTAIATTTVPTSKVTPPPKRIQQPSPNDKIYIVGDSYLAEAENAGLNQVVQAAGGSIFANASPSRGLTAGGIENQTALAAVQADAAEVKAAGKIIVEEGTNGGDNLGTITEMMREIRAENRTAPVWWFNNAALGYLPRSNQQEYMTVYNTENAALNRAARSPIPSLRFKILDWCRYVFGGTADTCTNSFADYRPGALASDDVHPSVPTGINDFDKLIVSVLP